MVHSVSGYIAITMILAASAALVSCTPYDPDRVLGAGKVVSISESQMIVEGSSDMMFYPIDAQHREALSDIEVGDEVTFLGTKEMEDLGNGHTRQSSEVDAIVLGDGLHMPMH